MMEPRRDSFDQWKGWLAMGPVVTGLLVVPWSRGVSGWMPSDDAGAFVPLVVLSLEVGLVVLAGWSARDARRLSAAVRMAGRVMMYLVLMGIAVLTAVMVAGGGEWEGIAAMQAGGGSLWLAFHDPFCAVACAMFFLASMVCVLTMDDGSAGGKRMAHGVALLMCVVQAALWLGAWYDPFGWIAHLEAAAHPDQFTMYERLAFAASVFGLVVFAIKVAFLLLMQKCAAGMWTARRGWRVLPMPILLPVALGNLLAEAAYLWLAEPLDEVQRAIEVVLAVVGWAVVLWLVASIAVARLRGRVPAGNS